MLSRTQDSANGVVSRCKRERNVRYGVAGGGSRRLSRLYTGAPANQIVSMRKLFILMAITALIGVPFDRCTYSRRLVGTCWPATKRRGGAGLNRDLCRIKSSDKPLPTAHVCCVSPSPSRAHGAHHFPHIVAVQITATKTERNGYGGDR